VLEQMTDKASGLGIVRFDKRARKITIECWPYLADPSDSAAKQFPGWPVTVDVPN
jgi:alkaline phosphatase D